MAMANMRESWRGEDDERKMASFLPLCGEAVAAIHAQAVGRIQSKNRLLLAVEPHDHFVVRVVAEEVSFHQPDNHRATVMDLTTEVVLQALEEECL